MKRIQQFLSIGLIMSLTLMLSCQQAEPTPSHDYEISDQAFKILQDQNTALVILDVRTPEEIADGMIPAAVHMDFYADDFDQQLVTLDKKAPIVIYCKSGNRAGQACDKLKNLGYEKVYNYGSYIRWLNQSK